jgi:hypothetical protein
LSFAEVRTAQGKLYLIVAIDRTSKFAFVELHEKVVRQTAGDFLRRLIDAVPYKVHIERGRRNARRSRLLIDHGCGGPRIRL